MGYLHIHVSFLRRRPWSILDNSKRNLSFWVHSLYKLMIKLLPAAEDSLWIIDQPCCVMKHMHGFTMFVSFSYIESRTTWHLRRTLSKFSPVPCSAVVRSLRSACVTCYGPWGYPSSTLTYPITPSVRGLLLRWDIAVLRNKTYVIWGGSQKKS